MQKVVLILITIALLILTVGCSVSPQAEILPTEPKVYTYEELVEMPEDQLLDLFVANGLEIDESLISALGMEEIQEIFKKQFEHWRRGISTLSYKAYLDLAQQTEEIYARICSDSAEATLAADPTLSILPGSFEIDSPMYAKGYDSIRELMEDVTLIVYATPMSVEAESEFAICYVLDVSFSSVEGIETIKLRQMKDEYQLSIGRSVVLALAPDEGEGYYHIPGGGAGLFTVNETATMAEGELLKDLLENSSTPPSADYEDKLKEVFDLLCTFE